MLKINKFILLFFILALLPLSAEDLTSIYHPGNGYLYSMKSKNGPDANVTIYFTRVSAKSLDVEYFIETVNTLIPSRVWQQFKLVLQEDKGFKVAQGYILADGEVTPKKMDQKVLQGQDKGVTMVDFLFKDKSFIAQHKIDEQEISVAAGKLKAHHYRVAKEGQIVDFWIVPNSRPMTMLKLTSTGSKPTHNYTLELETLVKNITAKINLP